MNHNDKFRLWREAMDKDVATAKEEIFSLYEIRQNLGKLIALDASPLQGVQITLRQHDVRHNTQCIGYCDGHQLSTQSDPLSEVPGIDGRIETQAWAADAQSISTSHWYPTILGYVRATWLPDLRERNYGLLDFKSESVRPRLPGTVKRLATKFDTEHLYAVYIDLDRFKEINDQLGHEMGDRAIGHVASCIEGIAKEAPLLGFRNGGDEFCLIVADTPIAKLLDSLRDLHRTISEREFGDKKLTVGFTAGIASIQEFNSVSSIEAAVSQAEAATKYQDENGKEQKKRGTVTIAGAVQSIPTPLPLTAFTRLAAVLARTFQGSNKPFANTLLNAVSGIASLYVANGQIDASAALQINQAIDWLGIKLTDELHEASLIGEENVTPNLSLVSVAVAIYHGLAKALAHQSSGNPGHALPRRFSLRCSKTGPQVALLADGKLVWGEQLNAFDEVDLGVPIQATSDTRAKIHSAAVAFQVGFQKRILSPYQTELPRQLFSDTVVVDDRPKTGGGLPDFWQAGVANIISAIGNNSNFKTLLVIGDPDNAPETVKRIKGETPLDSDELAVVTALSRPVVEQCITSLKTAGTIQFCNGFDDIIDVLYSTSLQLISWSEMESKPHFERTPKLKRTLDAGDLTLGALDGVRCDTAAQAYPLIVEILRTSEAVSTTYDDASQRLGEIVGFKLALKNPTQDPIPDYWVEQKSAFDEYTNDVLVKKDSFIAKSFHEDGQFTAFIDQLADYCSPENSTKSTRRAILVVKNAVEANTLRPLGLVSIWAAPRHHTGACNIEFCFVWRTVEALVGLPYSLFGSIMFAEHVISEVKKVHQAKNINIRLSLGKLTYLALSLHMRVDEFHRRIAKRIADAASV